jgi:hypothetical protein
MTTLTDAEAAALEQTEEPPEEISPLEIAIVVGLVIVIVLAVLYLLAMQA